MNLRKAYLLLYNGAQFCLWSLCLLSLLGSLLQFGDACEGYRACLPWVKRGQALAWAEALHALFGLAGGGAGAAVVQNLGRSAVLFAVLEHVSLLPCELATILIGVWAVGDIPRYALYFTALLEKTPEVLLWLRYSLFLVLYPLGMAAEWFIYYATLEEVDRTALHAIRLPNQWNFAFDFGLWNRGVLVSYAYFGPSMFMYMFRQRRRKLAEPKT